MFSIFMLDDGPNHRRHSPQIRVLYFRILAGRTTGDLTRQPFLERFFFFRTLKSSPSFRKSPIFLVQIRQQRASKMCGQESLSAYIGVAEECRVPGIESHQSSCLLKRSKSRPQESIEPGILPDQTV